MCKYCNNNDTEFIHLNTTSEYSGIEMMLNRQGMLRVRYIGDNTNTFVSQDIMNIHYCPMCGRKFNNGNNIN